MPSPDRLLVTAALPYANGPLHIGHIAGAYLPADLYCRYQRLRGRDCVFICGSDEMGVPILMRAREEGRDPQDVVDEYHEHIADSFERLGMSFDHYGRTSSETHRETTQAFFRHLAEKDVFELRTEEQLFDPQAEMFLADRFVRGTCPVCGYDDAYGDQCEKCGTSLSPDELVDPKSALTDAEPIRKETTHWYLPLGDYQQELESWLDGHTEWKPNVRGQVKSWLEEGLKERAITRDLDWGVPVPTDIAQKAGVDADGKVIYVWFDAPICYVSATKEWAEKQGQPEKWKAYWQDEGTDLIHFIGKDNIVFHCLMFPAMLMAHGDFVLPENVPANEFLNIEGKKLSTSRNWAVWLGEFLDDFAPDERAADLLRYSLAATLPETKDTDFSWSAFKDRINGELADVLGNFVNRSMTFADRFFGGKVPPLVQPSDADREVLRALAKYPAEIGNSYEAFRIREAVFTTIELARVGNKYFNDTEPWHTRKSDPQACANTVHVCLQICAALSILLEPVLPFAAHRLRRMVQLRGVREGTPRGTTEGLGWMDAGDPLLDAGHELGESDILFTKIEDEEIEAQMTKLESAAEQPDAADTEEKGDVESGYEPIKEEITFGDFMDLDLRMGTVTDAGPVDGADKLLRLEIDLGLEERQVLAGIAEQSEPDEMIGRRVVVVANLAPKEMFGLQSQGMVLMAEDRDGALHTITSDGENGAVVK